MGKLRHLLLSIQRGRSISKLHRLLSSIQLGRCMGKLRYLLSSIQQGRDGKLRFFICCYLSRAEW